MSTLAFAKGHGTRNDFVLLLDAAGQLTLDEATVRFLCDRRSGIGADGVLRAVRGAHVPDWDGDPDIWFMDYRNSDGSVAEMCGNGLRVFVRYLAEQSLTNSPLVKVGTRAGLRLGELLPDGQVRAHVGRVRVAGSTTVRLGGVEYPAKVVDVGNPHAVVELAELGDLTELDLSQAPQVDTAIFPNGANVEFVVVAGEQHLAMRVHERGSGETESCGTGVVASAAALIGPGEDVLLVDVPGGRLQVELQGGEGMLTGPAVIVAQGEVRLP